jgi:hypothetical protein
MDLVYPGREQCKKKTYRNEGGIGHTGKKKLTATGKAWREWVGTKKFFCGG